jgi:hypothetical protein
LTEEYPELTTFFDAEIIGNAYSFVTKKWDASPKTDKEHWVSVCKSGVSGLMAAFSRLYGKTVVGSGVSLFLPSKE